MHYFDNHWGGLFYVLSAFFFLNTLISLFALSPSPKIKGIIMQELINNKILFIGSFNINYSHDRGNINYLLKIIEETLFLISSNFKNLDNILYTKLPKALFKIRN